MKKLLVIAIVTILLVNILFVSAQVQEADAEGTAFQSFINSILKSLKLGEFSIVGVQRQCSSSADKTIQVPQGDTVTISASTYCSGGGLIDVFSGSGGWIPWQEFRDTVTFKCGSGDPVCNVEIYCCDHPEPTSDSQCDSWYAGSYKVDVSCSTSAPVGYWCPGESVIPYNRNSYSYCKQGTQINCYYYDGTGSSCKSVQQINSCPSTYMSYTLYNSLSTCNAQIQQCYDTSNKMCYNGKSYYIDSCGNRGSLAQDCSALSLSCNSNTGLCEGETCGNGFCGGSETCSSCPEDCGQCNVCNNNGVCDSGETASNCPNDCSNGDGDGIPDTETITWTEFYSTNDDDYGENNYLCKQDSDCINKEGYTVTCSDAIEFKDRNYKIYKDACDSGLGFLDNILSIAWYIGTLGIGKQGICDYVAQGRQGVDNLFQGSGTCLAESESSYGKIWEGTLKLFGSFGLPNQYVLIITIISIIMAIAFLVNFIK